MGTITQSKDNTPISSPNTTAKTKCSHEWLYKHGRGWYCRLCPATALLLSKDHGGVIILNDKATHDHIASIGKGECV